MTVPVLILGIGAGGLTRLAPHSVDAIRKATFLAGGRRHLAMVGPSNAEMYTITNDIEELVARLARRSSEDRCVVLASGDPLFFGIGHRITEALGPGQVRVEPAVSSVPLAFARIGLSWHDAAVASVHGRPLTPTLLPLLGRPKIALLTRDGAGPSDVATFFVNRGLHDYHAWVCENLEGPEEAIVSVEIGALVGQRFADLNVLILLRRNEEGAPNPAPPASRGLSDDAFAQPSTGPVLLTHQDVRALVVRRFQGLASGPIWDIGAGLGGVSVELARAFAGVEVVACERSASQIGYLKTNRARFGAYNLRLIEGEAPNCLADEAPPAGVFLGGSGGRLAPLLDLIVNRLQPGGRFVANFVGLENLMTALARLRNFGWAVDLAHIQVSEGRPLAGLTTFVPLRPVWIIRADRPE